MASTTTPTSQTPTPTETAPVTDGNLFKNGPDLLPATEKNILYNYRSFTYNWTLGALTAEALSNHKFV